VKKRFQCEPHELERAARRFALTICFRSSLSILPFVMRREHRAIWQDLRPLRSRFTYIARRGSTSASRRSVGLTGASDTPVPFLGETMAIG
jgi:hypothetical protein